MRPVDPCGLKRALLINDLSCFGKCSLSVSLPILSAYGVEAVPLPTAVLSTHTSGFTGYASVDMTEALRRFPAHWAQLGLRFDCIAVGYCTSAEQLRLAAALIRSLADEHTLVVVDPVLGDQGALYPGLKEAQVEAMRELCSLARWITPNRTEAALLAGLRRPDAAAGAADGKHRHYQHPAGKHHRLSGAAGRAGGPPAAGASTADAPGSGRCVHQRPVRRAALRKRPAGSAGAGSGLLPSLHPRNGKASARPLVRSGL